jgi:hypothetical protein
MLISTALLLDSIIRNSVCTPAKLPCRRVEVGYEVVMVLIEFAMSYRALPAFVNDPLSGNGNLVKN